MQLLLRTMLQIEDGALLWMYTSDLVKFWTELYTILLILSEIWSKGSNVTSLLLVNIFAEVFQVNAEALNMKSYQPQQKHCRGSAEAKFIFIYLPRHFICCCEKCWNSRTVYADRQLVFMSVWSQSWSLFFLLPAPKKIYCINPYFNWNLNLWAASLVVVC